MKRLVFCFDGTWNKLESETPTNVVITAESIDPLDGPTAQPIYYDQGVGTSFWDGLLGGIFGVGLVQNLAQAYRFLMFNYSPGDEIYIFGFSRGAYTARSFVGLLRNCGILQRRDAALVSEAIKLYRSRNSDDHPNSEKMLEWRKERSPHVCLDQEEDDWRAANCKDYVKGSSPVIRIRYLGVWDTVGSLGIPLRYRWWYDPMNRRHAFHDVSITSFVESARHAVAIDESRRDFQPTMWANFAELNNHLGLDPSDELAPYQQKWFPGTHGSVGGGGDRRGLSDQALDWVLSGARRMGLKLDSSPASRIYDLNPSHTEHIDNVPQSFSISGFIMGLFPSDRAGPSEVYEVSMSARRRYLEQAENLPERRDYRPGALETVKDKLLAIRPEDVGLGDSYDGPFQPYDVQPGEYLSLLAKRFYKNAREWPSIYRANSHIIEDPNRIYPGWRLRIPDKPWVPPER